VHVRALTALLAIALGAGLLAGCGSDEASGPEILRVGDGYDTIQDAVDAARPGDLVLIGAGTYHEAVEVTTERLVIRGEDRNEVVLDGRDKLTNGFEVTADQVAIENLTVQRYAINGIIFTGSYYATEPQSGPVGWRASYITAANNGLYGLYAFGTGPGVFEHSYASGHPDSGIYVGQCQDCGAVVRANVMERNAIGYENTNASGTSVIENTIRRNRIGMTISSGGEEELAPQSGGVIAANRITDSNEAGAPVTEGGFGVGIVIAGGNDNEVTGNVVADHVGAGIVLVDQDGFTPSGNRVTANTLSDVPVGLALTAEGGGQVEADGNCFSDNGAERTVPPGLEEALPCDGDVGPLGPETLTYPEAPPAPEAGTIALPERQPNRPGDPEGPWKPPSRTPVKVDLDDLQVPKP
jgi:parallel beta-helix repeat protein